MENGHEQEQSHADHLVHPPRRPGRLDSRPAPLHGGVHRPPHGHLQGPRPLRTFDADIVVGDSLDSTRLQAVVDLASVDTNNADRDAHLRGSDFFGVDAHPHMTFASTAITEAGPQRYTVTGDLTINGTTRSESLAVTFNGVETYPLDGSVHAGFEATGTISRKNYGLDFNVPLGAGGFVIADQIRIELDLHSVGPTE